MPDMQKTKSERLTAVLANVIQMKSEHLIHMKAKSKRLICRRRSLDSDCGASKCYTDEV